MSYMRGSPNYVWSTTCVLGKGATGAVYQGVNKTTGEPVAVKAFNHLSHMRPYEVQKREFEVLKKVSHDNIVKLLAIEEEVESHSKILVMELCTGGSLFNILDDPANSYGLEEEDFLLVLNHATAGMKHLRDNNIIHRDLKPGNIMKFIAEDGRSIYKLTDFGAARELDDDQQFMSLYGTEEYLHPDMYERAVLRKPAGKSFRATVDLWSIGVTLYHVATGSLPFRPYGGRKNKETMYYITSEKASGVISGAQHSENGPIEWNRDLPKSCLLSQFFSEVTKILSKKVFHIFYVNEGKEFSVYMDGNKSLLDLKEKIGIQTSIQPKSQLLLYQNDRLEKHVDIDVQLSEYPQTTSRNPLRLLHRDITEVTAQTGLGQLTARFPTFPTASVNLEHDASLAKICCSVAQAVQRLVERSDRCYTFLTKFPNILTTLISEEAKLLATTLSQVEETANNLDNCLKMFVNRHALLAKILEFWPYKHTAQSDLDQLAGLITSKKESQAAVHNHVKSLKARIKSFEDKFLKGKHAQQQWEQSISQCIIVSRCVETASIYVQKIRESWQSLVRDKAARTLSYSDEQFHILEKIKIQQTGQKLFSLLQDTCLKACHQVSQKLDDWYNAIQVAMVQCECLQKEIHTCVEMVKSHGITLEETKQELETTTEKIISSLKNTLPQENTGGCLAETEKLQCKEKRIRSNKSSIKHRIPVKLLKDIMELQESQSSLWNILQENEAMIAQLDQVMFLQLKENKNDTDHTSCKEVLNER
ncbi:serine/threonine-protein kinase TBK1-like isoform X2 [Tachypleus tridentatus]|uniref:serine/threonine-protein kinase TBK1-like isoform X2 n=1 Tax=Tachypleus tridentatus TaxID=6853 RepID=UPI003FD0FF93